TKKWRTSGWVMMETPPGTLKYVTLSPSAPLKLLRFSRLAEIVQDPQLLTYQHLLRTMPLRSWREAVQKWVTEQLERAVRWQEAQVQCQWMEFIHLASMMAMTSTPPEPLG